MKKHKQTDSAEPNESANAEPTAPLTRDEVTAAHVEALAVLKDLKRAEPRDADAVLQQKFVVQGFAAQLAALDTDATAE